MAHTTPTTPVTPHQSEVTTQELVALCRLEIAADKHDGFLPNTRATAAAVRSLSAAGRGRLALYCQARRVNGRRRDRRCGEVIERGRYGYRRNGD